MTKKLNIGTGKAYLPREEGWTNIDIFSSVKADVYADMTALPFDPGTFDLLYCSHTLEHVHRHMVLSTLTHFKYLLKPSGILRLAVPDFAAIAHRYSMHGQLDELMGLLYGGQNHPKNYHCIAFDFATLERDMKKVGFEGIELWDYRKTEHSAYDDFSRAFLPFRDETGDLMSLNIQGVRP